MDGSGAVLRGLAFVLVRARLSVCGDRRHRVGDGGLLLQGPAPIIDPYSCGVLAYEWTGNSTLRFEPYRGG